MSITPKFLRALLVTVAFGFLSSQAQAADIELKVNTEDDVVDQFGCDLFHCSLREAINRANLGSSEDIFSIFPVSQLVDEILLTSGQLEITGPALVEIFGMKINAENASRHLEVGENSRVEIFNGYLINGRAEKGGAILNHGKTELNDINFYNNSAVAPGNFGDGGAIYNASTGFLIIGGGEIAFNEANFGGGVYNNGGTVQIAFMEMFQNTAAGHPQSNGGGVRNWQNGNVRIGPGAHIYSNSAATIGGGIYNTGAILNIEDSRIENNIAGSGGGLHNNGIATIHRSSFESNSVNGFGDGGGIENRANLVLTNSTIYDNSAILRGGGIYNSGIATLTHNTIARNSASDGGGYAAFLGSNRFAFNFIGLNTSNSSTKDDCDIHFESIVESDGVNTDTDGSCEDFTTEVDPRMGNDTVLISGDGAAFVKALIPLTGSPLIDVGSGCSCGSEEEQRRFFKRPADGPDEDSIPQCDVGSVEVGATTDDPPLGVCSDESCYVIPTKKKTMAVICL